MLNTKPNIMIGTRVTKPMLDQIEAWRAKTRPVIGRSEALRLLLEDALAKPTNEQTT
jgi:hypothetical protein